MAPTLQELYPGRWASLLIPLRGKVATEKGWNEAALERYETGTFRIVSVPEGKNVGLVVPPGLLVLDCDTPEVSAWLAETLPDNLEYPEQRTRKGRRHYWVRLRDPDLVERQAPSYLPCGRLDLRRGGHGYVAVAPSIHPDTGEPYQWIVPLPADPDDVPFLPDEMLKIILDGQVAKPTGPPNEQVSKGGTVRPKPPLETNLAKLTQTRIEEGARNEYLYRRACAIVANAHPESVKELVAGLQVRNLEDCHPPLMGGEVYNIAASAWEHRAAPARVDPETGEAKLPGTICSTVKPEPVDWLWRYHIATGALTVIDGDGGIGKSLLLVDLAARVTTGAAWPDQSPGGDPRGVVLCSGEDELANTIIPRLEAAGANQDLVCDLRFPDLTSLADIDIVEAAVGRVGARLVIFDPVMDYLSGLDVHRDNEVRTAFHNMKELSRKLRFALVVSRHLSKGASGGKAAHAGLGSVGITNQARCQFLVTRNPDVKGGARLSLSKGNLSPPERLFVSREFVIEKAGPLDGSLSVTWGDDVAMSADDCLQAARTDPGVEGAKKGPAPVVSIEVANWLKSVLANGPVLSADVWKEAEGFHFTESAVARAKKLVGVVSFQPDGARWWMRVKGDERAAIPRVS